MSEKYISSERNQRELSRKGRDLHSAVHHQSTELTECKEFKVWWVERLNNNCLKISNWVRGRGGKGRDFSQ